MAVDAAYSWGRDPTRYGFSNDLCWQGAPANRDPYNGLERFVRRHLTRIDNPDLRHIQNAANGCDQGSSYERKEFKVACGVTAEKNAIFAIANSSLHQAEFRAV